jgi:tetratricopeptide (TPR) repeat protein
VGRWCGGNPYFVEELVSWMVTKELLVRGPDGWQLRGDPAELELPIGVEGAIQGRLDGLAPELKELLKGAAVLGEVFWAGGCEALGFSAAAEQLRRLEQAEFVTRRGTSRITGEVEWAFRHALLHQVAYQMLPRERRGPLHLLCAGWLEAIGETDAALLARHFERGGDERRAAQCHARAGSRALSDGDLERAVACFQTSLAGPTARLEERHERMMGLARARILLGRYDEAWQDLDALAALGVEAGAEVPFMRGRVLYVRGRYREAEATLGRAAEALGARGDGDLRFEIRHSLFWVMWVQGRYDDARPTAEQIHRQAVEDSRLDHLCAAKLCLSYCHKVGGDLSLSVRLAEEAVAHARELGHPFREVDALVFLGTLQELVGLYDEAYAALEAARGLAARLKTVHNQASIEALLGRVSLAQQRVPEALAHYRGAVEKAHFLGDDRHLAIALAGEARALCRTGVREDQNRALEGAQRALELTGDRAPPVEAKARLVLSEVNRALGRVDQAIEQALTAIDLLDRLGTQERYEIEILLAAHDALAQAGRADEARELLDRARRTLRARTRAIGDEAVRDSFARRVPYNLRAAGPDRS